MRRRRPAAGRLALAVIAAAGLAGGTGYVARAEVSPDVIQDAIYKTVVLFIPYGNKDNEEGGRCSGSLVTAGGLILTAAHCVRLEDDDPKHGLKKGDLPNPDGVAYVGLNLPEHVNPVYALLAHLVTDTGPSPKPDLALFKPVALLGQNGTKPLPPDFRVPGVMALRDSSSVKIGESIAVLGFPAVGGDSITVVQGHVTGFDADKEEHKLWLKHDAAQAPGHSGGPIIDSSGRQVAVVSHRKTAGISQAPHAALINRMPHEWAQYLQGGAAAAVPRPQPAAPTKPVPPAKPAAPGRPATPAPRPPQPVGTVIRGRVVDAVSKGAIPGAAVLIFRPGANIQTAGQGDLVASARTDPNGMFQTNPPVPKGNVYPFYVQASGYRPVLVPLQIPANATDLSPVFTVALQAP